MEHGFGVLIPKDNFINLNDMVNENKQNDIMSWLQVEADKSKCKIITLNSTHAIFIFETNDHAHEFYLRVKDRISGVKEKGYLINVAEEA